MRQKVLFLLAKLVASQLLLLLGHNLAVQVEQQNILAAQICRRSTVAWFSGVSTRFLLLQYDDDDDDGSAKMPLLHKQTNKNSRQWPERRHSLARRCVQGMLLLLMLAVGCW